uniref:Ig-like domain-containing protein n=1 Tax=Sinocyclocheilus rhinocerous TaxID=307959 RepID=A0A673KRD5_9TELE
MYDDTREGVLKVFISDLTAADEGTYRCGVNIADDHLFTEVTLTVNQGKELLSGACFWTLSSMPPLVRREGDSAEIKCPYNANYSKEVKHLCKGKCFTQDALKIIQSEDHDKNPKISVKDDTELNLFTVTMTELRAEDAGKYWCAVKDAFDLPIELMIIMKDVFCSSVLVTRKASVGGSASISCKYIKNQNQCFFCRGDQPNICVKDGVRVSSKNRINGRFSLTDETSAGVFTVNISNLRAEDSGKYWCAEEHSGSFIFTEVYLHSQSLCVISEFSVTAAVSVGLILLALVTALLLFKRKHNKHGETQTLSDASLVHTGIISSTDRRETGDHETVSFGSTSQFVKYLICMLFFMYWRFCVLQAQEEIQDARRHSDSDPESTPLYLTVQLPTIPSDSQNPVYSTVQLPTIPSDSQNPVYSTVHGAPDEESLSDATVRFSKDEIHSVYASVNHSFTPNIYFQWIFVFIHNLNHEK